MQLRPDQPGSQIDNRMALRIALFGGVVVALFGILFFRLWFLQILNGEEYLAEARNNRTHEVRVTAPRGTVLDRNGEVLVENRTSLAIQVDPRELPEDERERQEQVARLAELTRNPLKRVRQLILEGAETAPGAPVTLRRDVGKHIVYYLLENQERFPGVTVERVFVRDYPEGTLAAHILGNVGEVNEDELNEARYSELVAGDEVGRNGVEYTYDHILRGEPGISRTQVDAFGRPTAGDRLESVPPVAGKNLKLSIDAEVQAAGEAGLAAYGPAGAFVTMDVHSGEVLGMGSYPTFDPSVFTRPMTQAEVDALFRDPVTAAAINRAVTGLYPTGSTYKIITALAALESGAITPSETIFDNGAMMIGDQRFQNAGAIPYGSVALEKALTVSSDIYFYTLGWKMWNTGALQDWSRKLGIGRTTGLDLPSEAEGLVPTRKWRDDLYAEGLTDRPWSVGDNVQLAIGQGDLQTNPLQMAVAYAALANGGTLVTPHVAMQVDDALGRVLREIERRPRGSVRIDPGYRRDILAGLHEAAQNREGTSYEQFGNFPVPVAGKTGTAQRAGQVDQAWFIVLAPYPNPKIVTAVTIEQGGFGAETAAPVALEILEAYFDKQSSGPAGPNGGSPG